QLFLLFSLFFTFLVVVMVEPAFPLFMVSICLIFLLNASPLIAYFVKLFSVIFTFYVDRLRPQAYSLHMALMPNERSANVPDVPVLPRNRPTPQGFLRPYPRKAQTQRLYQNRPRNLHPPLPQNHRRTHLQISHKETMR
ncbi:MAG: hypothetical protein M3036_00650, partial [Bifidobacteriales bacterium]|nr:hypothetical protein [Bifidobacteriales bacterium]